MRRVAVITLSCICAMTVLAAWPPLYPQMRAYVEEHSPTNSVPKDERLFLRIDTLQNNHSQTLSQILRYQSTMTLRTIIDQSAFSNSDVHVLVLRAWQSNGSGTQDVLLLKTQQSDGSVTQKVWDTQWVFDEDVKPGEKPAIALKPLDMICLLDTGFVRQ